MGLRAIARAVDFPGYRRNLLARFAGWTTDERHPGRPSPTDDPVVSEEWAVFGHYRAILGEIGAEDAEGFAAWASRRWLKEASPELAKVGHVVVVDPIGPTRAEWRLLEALNGRARSMTVTLPYDPAPALAELYASVGPVRERLLEWGFVEEPDRPEGFSYRPRALDFIERELFRPDVDDRPKLGRNRGLKIVGGPRGEGVSLLIAREVRNRLQSGTPPEEVLILVPRVDEEAERIREALASWGRPVAPSPAGRLSSIPALAAFRLAIRLPVDRWDVSGLVRLLRNGQVRWPGGLATPFGPSEAASAIRSTRVFRDRAALRTALASTLERKPRDRVTLLALEAIDRLSDWLDPVARPGPWPVQVERLRALSASMGLDPDALQPFWDALEDRGWVLARLGPAIAEETLPWADFVEQVEALAGEVVVEEPTAVSGTVRIEAVGDSGGVRASCVILAGLDERSFPTPGSVDLGPIDEAQTSRDDLAYSREMLRFARVAGMAEESLVLAYPMTDLNGESLLPAGFLGDLIRRLDDGARAEILELHARFDPVLDGHEELARSPVDARVLAVAHACAEVDFDRLRRLSGSVAHAPALLATADAFVVASRRRDDREFGPHDGRLRDESAIGQIAARFGPAHAFSPSQLESFALCPFQFYQRYVLGLKLGEERREFDEDYAGRGHQVHDALERIHQQVAAEGDPHIIERLDILIRTEMRVELDRHDGRENDVAEVIREIATRRTNRTLERYLGQFRKYFENPVEASAPHQFEVLFGQPDNALSHPHLTIGEGGEIVLLQGKIDRVDLVTVDGEVRFRIIDYKTGSCPSKKDVLDGLASQLPLYALAAEQLVRPGGGVELIDVGYWSLPKDGYKSLKLGEWHEYRDRLSTFVVELVGQLRGGAFPIESPKKDCRKYCDFRTTCRVVEVRGTGKAWADRPKLEPDR